MQNSTSNINMLFQSPKNKAAIVDALTAAGIITKHTQRQAIIQAVEKGIATTIRTRQSTESLIDMNKRAIIDIRGQLIQPQAAREPYTSQDIADARKASFDMDVQKRQEEFDSFMKRDTPQGMDFSDTLDKPIGSEMDALLAQAASRRELDMNPHNIKLSSPSDSVNSANDNNTTVLAKINSIEAKVNTIEGLLHKLIATIDKQDS